MDHLIWAKLAHDPDIVELKIIRLRLVIFGKFSIFD